MEAEPVLDSEGEETGEYPFNANGALKAIELQGKYLGMWTGEPLPPRFRALALLRRRQAPEPVQTTATGVPAYGVPISSHACRVETAGWHQAAIEARGQAEADLDHARDQLAQARAEFARLIAEIRIEGAESVDIGGEVRTARLVEAEWQRAVDAVVAHIGKIDAAIVMRGGQVPEEQRVLQSRR